MPKKRKKKGLPPTAVTPEAKARLREDQNWAKKSGPVTTRKATPEELSRKSR